MKSIYLLLSAMLLALSGSPASAQDAGPFAAAVKENGKWGIADASGHLTVPTRYDAAGITLADKDEREADLASMENRRQLIEVKDGKLHGFYTRTGGSIVPVSYEARSFWIEDALAVQTDKKHIGFYRSDGKKLSDPIYEEASDFHNGFAVVKRDGRYGYLDKDGREITPVYKEARYFANDHAPVKDKKWGVIDSSGMITVPCRYDDAGPFFSEGLLAVKKDNRWGFIDPAGKEVVPLMYRAVQPVFSERYTAVQNEDKLWGFINAKGETTAEPIFKKVVTPFHEGLAGVVTKDGKAYARPDGTVAFQADFDRIYAFQDGLAEYRVGELVERRPGLRLGWGFRWGFGWRHRYHPWGFGWPMWDPWWYDGWYEPSRVDTQEKRGYLDESGKIIAAASLDRVYPATEKGILVFNKNRFGWIDKTGQYTIHTEYRALVPDTEQGFLLARDEKKNWGLLNFTGQALAPFSYDSLQNLGQGYAAYKQDGRWGLLNKDGKILTAPLYEEIRNGGDGLFPAREKGTWLYLDTSGHPAITFSQPVQDALPFKDGFAGVRQSGKWGIIDTSGRWTANPRFDAYLPL